jgi:AraC family transcriptional regulator, regulatory protein of adaptative response / methylated-DNA-[protein]-cysteine methyltransferase
MNRVVAPPAAGQNAGMSDYDRIARVIRYLDQRQGEQPDLASVAAQLGLSPSHFHRLFSGWAGVTPKDFLQCLTLRRAKELLSRGRTVLDAALESGLSGPGRLHDLCVSLEAASPGELQSGGAGWTLTLGFANSPFGRCLVGASPRGVCHLSFVESPCRAAAAAALGEEWPRARVRWDDGHAARLMLALFAPPRMSPPAQAPLRAFVRGSAFRVRVWRALLRVPPGTLVSYRQLASAVGSPSAARAVGTAVAANPLAYLIPCHRVIRETGVAGEYRWGPLRKRAMIAWEGSEKMGSDRHFGTRRESDAAGSKG